MRTFFLILLFVGGSILSTQAQTNECISDFDYLVQKIKADYPGYSDKVTAGAATELLTLEKDIRRKLGLYPDSCGYYLNQYASWFKDNHLRVRRVMTAGNSANSGIDERRFTNINPTLLIALQSKTETSEGIWHSYNGDIAIVKENDKFIGIAIQYKGYEKGQIIFQLTPTGTKDEFSMISYPAQTNYTSTKGLASLRLNDKVLEIHNDTKLVRKTGSATYDNAFLYSYTAEFPNGLNTYPVALSLTDSTFYLRTPSFRDENTEILTKKHWGEITSRPNLIIDIRNNGGGQDNYYQILADLIYTNPYERKGVEWYATKNNIKILEDNLKSGKTTGGEEGLLWTKALLSEMKKNVGGFVTHPLMGHDGISKKDTVYPLPKRIGIIINERDASSAEQFILESKHSSKVILFGNSNTAGVLDYSNAIRENFPSGKYQLIFPQTRSRRLPENPIDNIGISPDIIIPYPETIQLYTRLDQWVYFVQNYLEQLENKK